MRFFANAQNDCNLCRFTRGGGLVILTFIQAQVIKLNSQVCLKLDLTV